MSIGNEGIFTDLNCLWFICLVAIPTFRILYRSRNYGRLEWWNGLFEKQTKYTPFSMCNNPENLRTWWICLYLLQFSVCLEVEKTGANTFDSVRRGQIPIGILWSVDVASRNIYNNSKEMQIFLETWFLEWQ